MNKDGKIYIAGHTGLVGSAIVKNLKSKGYNKLIYKTHSELDLMDSTAVAEFFKSYKPDYVILAAAKVGGIIANNTYRAEFIYDNLQIQNNIIHQSYLHKVKKLMFLGSSCIYPKNTPQPMVENSLLSSPLEYTNEPYAIAKIAGIKMCESYNLQYGTNFISVMPTNLYGINDNFDLKTSHVLPALIRKIYLAKLLKEEKFDEVIRDLELRPIDGVDGNSKIEIIINLLKQYGISKEQVTIWGSGEPKREFLYSLDMADACVFVMENINFEDTYTDTKEIRNTHINIGSGEDIKIKDLAVLIAKVVGYDGEFVFDVSKPDGTMQKLQDVSKLSSLGWNFSTSLTQGIKKVHDWYKGDMA